ncbi:MAG: hypothetical protein ACRCV0_01870, partial [Brevinema sp.]
LTVKAQGISEDLAQKRMKNQGVDFLEKISSNQFVAMKKEAPEEVMVKFALERNLLKEYAQYILKSTNVNDLLENWAKGRLYVNAIRRSISTKTYPIKDAQDLLAKFNRSAFKANECQDLVIFANSLIDKKARVFTFGMDQASLEFLFDLKWAYGSCDRDGSPTTTKAKLEDKKFQARDTLIKYAIQAFYALGKDFTPIKINSGYRTHGWQADYLVKNSGTWGDYDTTKKLMEFTRDIYNGMVDKEYALKVYYKEIEDSELLYRITNLYNYQKLFNEGYIAKLKQNDQTTWIDVLEEIFIADLYSPSPHPDGYTVDLQISDNKGGEWIYNNALYKKKYPRSGFGHIQFQ